MMSERGLQRIEVLSKVLARRMTVVSGVHVLDLTIRHVQTGMTDMRTEATTFMGDHSSPYSSPLAR